MNHMSLTSKEHYELMAAFEKQFMYLRLDREAKSLWPTGRIYQDGQANELFLAFRCGAAYAAATLRLAEPIRLAQKLRDEACQAEKSAQALNEQWRERGYLVENPNFWVDAAD